MAVGATAAADVGSDMAALTAGGLVEVKADCGWAARLLAGILTGAFILLGLACRGWNTRNSGA